MYFFEFVVGCLMVCLVSSPARGEDQSSAAVVRELTELISSRRKAIASVEIVAEHLSLGDGLLKPFDTESLRRVLADYAASERAAADRAQLYDALCKRDGAKLYKRVTLVQEGARTSLSQEGEKRYVTDHRATVRSTMPGSSAAPTAEIYGLEGTLRPLDLRNFSLELKSQFLKKLTAGQVVVDDKGQLLVAGTTEPSIVWKMSLSREDGILAFSQADSPRGRWVTIQAGRMSTLAEVPFPAVTCEAHFVSGAPNSLILLVPIAIKVNETLPEKSFTVAMPSGTKIVDKRGNGDVQRFAAKDVEDIVELANSLAAEEVEQKSSKP